MSDPFDYKDELPAINDALKQAAVEYRAEPGDNPTPRAKRDERNIFNNLNESLDSLYSWPNNAQRSPTPKATIDAVMHCVCVRGIAALKEPTNVERMSRCDDAAKDEIKKRISALRGQS
jgi:hypothetical protein